MIQVSIRLTVWLIIIIFVLKVKSRNIQQQYQHYYSSSQTDRSQFLKSTEIDSLSKWGKAYKDNRQSSEASHRSVIPIDRVKV